MVVNDDRTNRIVESVSRYGDVMFVVSHQFWQRSILSLSMRGLGRGAGARFKRWEMREGTTGGG